MDVRSQVSMVFHLDKCIGCHTCSIACKNIWTDRKGTEYMWWNNVETKPGTGFPTRWEDQEKYQRRLGDERTASSSCGPPSKAQTVVNIFHNPHHAHAWTTTTSRGPTTTSICSTPPKAPTSRRRGPISMVTGESIDIEAGPNWDDDLGGSPIYADNDPNLEGLTEEQREQLFAVERLVFFYFPRICNHCLNPSCVAACPSGALYKRGEDGIVLVDQKRCRGWRACVAACPYKKMFYNWHTGKSEKCILCYPAPGDRAGAGLLPLLRRPHPLPGRAALRRRADRGGGRSCRTRSWSKRSAR